MNSQCIVFITDQNYVFPTFVAAKQARQHASPNTDVIIMLSLPTENVQMLQAACDRSGILLLDRSQSLGDAFDSVDQSGFQHRISVTTLARLLLGRVLPVQYEQIIYIDGDTQIVSSLNALEELAAPKGKFYAAADYMVISAAMAGNTIPFYFNPGILKFARDGWIGEAAFEYFSKHSDLKYHDMDALNIVGKDLVIPISNKWNFPKHYLHLVDPRDLGIVHYMAHPKPWDGTFFPWRSEAAKVYDQTIVQYPSLKSFRSSISPIRKAVYKMRSIQESLREGNPNPTVKARLSQFLNPSDFVV